MDTLTKQHLLSLQAELLAIVERMDNNYGYPADALLSQADAQRLEEITKTLNNIRPDTFTAVKISKEI